MVIEWIMVAPVDSSDCRSRCVVRLSLEIEGLWRADYIKWGLPGPGHVTCSRAVTTALNLLHPFQPHR